VGAATGLVAVVSKTAGTYDDATQPTTTDYNR
jgi:hypothetical protein